MTLALLWACGGDSADREPTRPNVVLIVVDTLRADHLSCYGYERNTSPHLDRFAESAVRYERAISQAPWTTPSIGAILSSQYPSTLGIKTEKSILAEDLVLLAEVLGDAGYVTGAVVSHSFCSSEWGFGQGFDYFDEDNVLGHAAVTSTSVTDKALSFVEEFGSGDAPFFLWVHYFDPHCAYVEHEGHEFGGSGDYEGVVESGQLFRELMRLQKELGARDVEELLRLYDSEIAYTDGELGRLFDALERDGRREDTLVLLTADHGEEFLEHGHIGHAKTLYEEVISVPLLARYPGVPGGVVSEPVALIDLYPTVLDVVDLPAPEGIAGVSIAPGNVLDPDRIVYSETERSGGLLAAITADHKLVIQRKRGREEFFHCARDPGENHPGQAPEDAVGTRLEEALERFRVEVQERGRVAPEIQLDEEARQRLDHLGYGGGEEEGE